MSDELVEALAQRLHNVGELAVRVVSWDVLDGELCAALAYECLRQMEWVRSECRDLVGGAAEDTDERISNLKLTMAPNDWSPPHEKSF